jgi:histidinol-phosphatase
MNSPYLDAALQATKAAEEIILKYLGKDLSTQIKSDLSPVTIADQEAEEIIKSTIRRKFPDHTFYGEEGEKIDLSNHKGCTWIIDPIDGTKSYMRGNPLFATQLALLQDGELVIGISNAPMMRELMYAEKGQGCYLNSKPVAVAKTARLNEAYASFGAIKYFENHASAGALMQLAQSAKWARGIGDFWSYHLLAQGKLDIMCEADTKLWDIAALKVIVEEAGGTFTQLDGNPVSTTSTSALATNGLVHEAVLDLFRAN